MTEALQPRAPATPGRGWRRIIHRATGGRVHPGPSPTEQRTRQQHQRISQPLADGRTIVVLSRKGGVGTTTTTVLLGQILASVRPSPVVAIDAHADQGTLAERVSATATYSVRDAARIRGRSVAHVREMLARDASRLDVLGHPRNPLPQPALSVSQLQTALNLIRHHYPLVLCEIGTDLTQPVAEAVLAQADAAVVVGAETPDQAHAVVDTVAHLRSRGLPELAEAAVVALHAVPHVDSRSTRYHLRSLTNRVVRVPLDSHVAQGGVIHPDWLAGTTRAAGYALADAVVSALADTPTSTRPTGGTS